MRRVIIAATLVVLFLAVNVAAQIPPEIITEPVTEAYYGLPYYYDVDAVGDPIPWYLLQDFPQGMEIDGDDGLIKWVPPDLGLYEVVVIAENGFPPSAVQPYSITVTWDWETCILRGDIDNNNDVNPLDLVALISFLWLGGPRPIYGMHCDINGDGNLVPTEVLYFVNYFYNGGPPPAPCPD